MNNDMMISISRATAAAAEYAGYSLDDIRDVNAEYVGGTYEISFNTDWGCYDCYVNAVASEVLGFNYEPSLDTESIYGQDCGACLPLFLAANK